MYGWQWRRVSGGHWRTPWLRLFPPCSLLQADRELPRAGSLRVARAPSRVVGSPGPHRPSCRLPQGSPSQEHPVVRERGGGLGTPWVPNHCVVPRGTRSSQPAAQTTHGNDARRPQARRLVSVRKDRDENRRGTRPKAARWLCDDARAHRTPGIFALGTISGWAGAGSLEEWREDVSSLFLALSGTLPLSTPPTQARVEGIWPREVAERCVWGWGGVSPSSPPQPSGLEDDPLQRSLAALP